MGRADIRMSTAISIFVVFPHRSFHILYAYPWGFVAARVTLFGSFPGNMRLRFVKKPFSELEKTNKNLLEMRSFGVEGGGRLF